MFTFIGLIEIIGKNLLWKSGHIFWLSKINIPHLIEKFLHLVRKYEPKTGICPHIPAGPCGLWLGKWLILLLEYYIKGYSLQGFLEHDSWITIELQHSLGSTSKSFSFRGNVTIPSLNSGLANVAQPPLTDEELEQLKVNLWIGLHPWTQPASDDLTKKLSRIYDTLFRKIILGFFFEF